MGEQGICKEEMTKKELQEENKRLKDFIWCECDHLAAYAPFDELGNKAMAVKRYYCNLGDIIPDLKELYKEVSQQAEEAAAETRRLIGI